MIPALEIFAQAHRNVMARRAHYSLQKRLRPKHALSTDVYGRPDPEHLDQLEAHIQQHAQGELLGIWFQGRSRDTSRDTKQRCNITVRAVARSAQGRLFTAAYHYNPPVGCRGDVEVMANWGAREKIGIGRDASGQWAWFSQKSQCPSQIFVEHLSVAAHRMGCGIDEYTLAIFLKDSLCEEALHLIEVEERMVSAKTGFVWHAKPEDERRRLQRLVPEDKVDAAFAMSEQEAIRAAIASGPSTPNRPSSPVDASVPAHARRL